MYISIFLKVKVLTQLRSSNATKLNIRNIRFRRLINLSYRKGMFLRLLNTDFHPHVVSGITLTNTGVQVSLTYSPSVTPTVASNTNVVTIGTKVSASIAMQTAIVRLILPFIFKQKYFYFLSNMLLWNCNRYIGSNLKFLSPTKKWYLNDTIIEFNLIMNFKLKLTWSICQRSWWR